jgi:hypothetical protein
MRCGTPLKSEEPDFIAFPVIADSGSAITTSLSSDAVY